MTGMCPLGEAGSRDLGKKIDDVINGGKITKEFIAELNQACNDLDYRITKLFKKYIVKRPNGNCQILFALTELDALVGEILKEVKNV